MSNKIAEEQAEAALDRVAARQAMERKSGNGSGLRIGSGVDSLPAELRLSGGRAMRTSLTSVDESEDGSVGSINSHRSRSRRNPARQKIFDTYKKDSEYLKKQLSNAESELAELNTNLKCEEIRFKSMECDFKGIERKLEDVQEEKAFLVEAVRDIEDNYVDRDKRLEKLQQVVETQSETVAFMENKLGKMEDDYSALLGEVEDKKETKKILSKSAKKWMGSIRKDFDNLKDSFKIHNGEAIETTNKESCDSREKQLDMREQKLQELEAERSDTNENNPKSPDKAKLMKMELENEHLRAKLHSVSNGMIGSSQVDGDIDQEEAANANNEDELSNALALVDERNQLIKSLKEDIEKLQGKFQTKKDDLTDTRALVVAHKERVKSLEEEIEKLGGKCQTNEGDLFNALALVEKKEEHIKSLEDKVEELGGKCQINEVDLTDALALVEELKERTKSLEVEVEKLGKVQSSDGEMSDVLALVNLKKEHIKNLEEEIKKLGKRCQTKDNDLSDALALVGRKKEHIKSLEEEVEKLSAKCQTNGGDLSDALILVGSKSELIKSLEEEVEKIGGKSQINEENLSDALVLVDSQKERIKSLEEEVEELNGKQQNNEGDLSNAKALVDAQKENIKNLEEEVEKLDGKYQTKAGDLSDALALVQKNDERIKILEEEAVELNALCQTAKEEIGKDDLIIELQKQLVTAKKQAHQLSSGSYVTKVKHEVKALKENIRGLKIRLKQEGKIANSNLKKKDDATRLVEKQLEKLKFELEKREKRDATLGSEMELSGGDFKKLIEDLEEEIIHWKSSYADLKNEVEQLKSNPNLQGSNEMIDDSSFSFLDASQIGAHTSSQEGLNMSQHSTSSVQSLGAMHTVTSIWSKMRGEPPKPNPVNPYGPGSFNNE